MAHAFCSTHDCYLNALMADVKNLRVKHVRKLFVMLRDVGTACNLASLESKTDWSNYDEFTRQLQTVVVEHGLTLGEFATGYVLNIVSRQRDKDLLEEKEEEESNSSSKPSRKRALPKLVLATSAPTTSTSNKRAKK